jgi:hypothetical protein
MSRSFFCGVLVVCVLSYPMNGPGSLSAATVATQVPASDPLDHIDQVLVVDELGFECVPENRIDAAFHLSGKGVRMPRTCLPAPCKAALSPDDLAYLIGRPASQSEWDEYYARYGDVCRAEVTPFGEDDRLGGASTGSAAPDEFWGPFIAGIPVDFQPDTTPEDTRPFVPLVPGVSSVFGSSAGPFLSGGSSGGGDGPTTGGGGTGGLPPLGNLFGPEEDDDPERDDETTEEVIINSAPLPGSLIGFVSALAGAGFLAARSRRRKAA